MNCTFKPKGIQTLFATTTSTSCYSLCWQQECLEKRKFSVNPSWKLNHLHSHPRWSQSSDGVGYLPDDHTPHRNACFSEHLRRQPQQSAAPHLCHPCSGIGGIQKQVNRKTILPRDPPCSSKVFLFSLCRKFMCLCLPTAWKNATP